MLRKFILCIWFNEFHFQFIQTNLFNVTFYYIWIIFSQMVIENYLFFRNRCLFPVIVTTKVRIILTIIFQMQI